MSKLRIGIIGTGSIAKVHVRELLRLSDRAEILAVVDLSADKAEWVVAQTGATYYPDVASALEHIDAAYLTTPPRARVEAVKVLAEAGKAIFCEKPLAGTVEDARLIEEIIERTGVPFMMGFMRRWHPPYAALKQAADSAGLGKPLQFSRRRLGYLNVPAGNWRVTGSQLTGLTIESVSHDIDLLRWLGGDVIEVSGEVIESRNDLPGYDDMMVATLRFASGAIGLLQVGWSSLVFENEVGVYGSEGAAVIDGEGMWRSDRLRTGNLSEQNMETARFEDGVADEDGYPGQTSTFLALARGETIDHPGIADGVATVEISYRVLNSSRSKDLHSALVP